MCDIDLQSSDFSVSCPLGYNLLSCGTANSVNRDIERFRSAKAIDNKTCVCHDAYDMTCAAWCTTLPVQGYEIIKVSKVGTFTASCPTDKTALGCHLDPMSTVWEPFRQYYPNTAGDGCNCYDTGNSECSVTCASQIRDYEVISVWSSGTFYANCGNPTNRVLGCGIDPSGSSNIENFRAASVQYPNACKCVDGFGARCYAICGKIW